VFLEAFFQANQCYSRKIKHFGPNKVFDSAQIFGLAMPLHVAMHFLTTINLTTSFRKSPVMHMKCSCVCAIENHLD